MTFYDPYGNDVLSNDPHVREARPVHVEVGMVLEDVQSGYVGEVMKVSRVAGAWQMELEDGDFRRRSFPLRPGFWLEGQPVKLLTPKAEPRVDRDEFGRKTETVAGQKVRTVAGKRLTASGSLHVAHAPRVARPSRIWVEGKHDAELISKIWGEDLAYEGIMLEELFGADHLLEVLEFFGPDNEHRAGILLDHLVPGSKESRIAEQAMEMEGVLVLGHPFVDIWQSIKPATLGIPAWPDVPRNEDIKVGTLRRLGWPSETPEDVGLAWKRMLDSVTVYTDLEPALLSQVELLIDFVSAGA